MIRWSVIIWILFSDLHHTGFYRLGISLKDVISKVIDFCIHQRILADFLKCYLAEMTDMLLSEYDKKQHMRMVQKGIAAEISLLAIKLLELNLLDNLNRSATYEKYQRELLKEFRIGEFEFWNDM